MVVRKMAYWFSCKISGSNSSRQKNALKKVRKHGIFLGGQSKDSINRIPSYPSVTKCCLNGRESQKLVCDFGALLRSQSLFPYFMLVAFEGGSIFRAFFLLLSFPLLWVLDFKNKLRVMIFISFCGLRLKDMDVVAKAVLPKFYLENFNLCVYEVFASMEKRMVFTSLPRVMVERFLKEYLSVDTFEGTELHTIGQFFTGFLSSSGLLEQHKADLQEFCGDQKMPTIGIGSQNINDEQQFLSLCQETYVVNKDDLKNRAITVMPRERYPKPLIFHDGRLAFFPTPLATLKMYVWLPFGIILSTFRIFAAAFLPYKLAAYFIISSGAKFVLKISNKASSSTNINSGKGVLYVCNHRTLVDPAVLLVPLD